MRKCFLPLILLFLLASPIISEAQKLTGCGYKIPPRSLLKTRFASVYEAKIIIRNMLDSIKWKENFSVKESNGIQNAYATILNGVRWIVYDNNFLEDIDEYAATKWASISILAHEMGHHYYNHVVSSQGSTPPREIEADAFSGYIMAKLGATLDQSIAAMSAIGSDKASATHPAKKDRLDAITRGWNAGKANSIPTSGGGSNPSSGSGTGTGAGSGSGTGAGSGTNNPGQGSSTPSTPPASDPSWIYLTIQSNKNETVYLSDDGKKYQAAEIKQGQPFVFKFEVYNYGWLRLPYYNGYRVFKLLHGKDYSILWNRRKAVWTVVEVGD